MSDEVKPEKRRYNSARRQQQAQETRRQILAAARDLFLDRGYPAVTMEAIAERAGVSVESVYASFRNKRTILARLVDVSAVGDDEDIPLLERGGPQELLRETDQRRQIRLFAAGIRDIMTRVGPLFNVMQVAAMTEPEIAALLSGILGERLQGMRFFVEALSQNGRLRPGPDLSRCVDVVWTLTSAEVHRLLTVDRGWSGDQYEEWLAATLARLLLPEVNQDGAVGSC